jgi:hypothetical protein
MPYAEQLRKIKTFLRNVFAIERLEEAPIAANHRDRKRQFAAILFRREPLALEAEPPPRPPRPGLLRALFAREVLPDDPPEPPRPPSARAGFFRALFAPEPLPELPPASAKPRRAAWLRWLFRFERLDPP